MNNYNPLEISGSYGVKMILWDNNFSNPVQLLPNVGDVLSIAADGAGDSKKGGAKRPMVAVEFIKRLAPE